MSLTISEAARILNCSEQTVREQLEKGNLPFQQINRRILVNQDELIAWAAMRGMPPVLPDNHSDSPLPGLADAMRAGGVLHNLPGTNKKEVLRNLTEQAPLPAGMEPKFLYDVLLAREALGSTAVGDGVALPHPRSPMLLRVPHAMVTLSFLAQPVDFGAPDGRPVYALFTLISPTLRVHLRLLANLAFALRASKFKACLQRRALMDEMLPVLDRLEEEWAGKKV